MAFDRTDPADLLALKTEVNTDPISMGYAAVVDQTQNLLKLLNDPTNNVGGETAQGDLTPRVLWELAADNPDDFTPHGQFSEGDQFVMQQLFEISNLIDDDLNWARDKISNIFPAADGFRIALEALSKLLSRSEVLFGENTVITRDDWIAARES